MVAPCGSSLPRLGFSGTDNTRRRIRVRHLDSYRLSCIEEHEKENSRDCEDGSPGTLSYVIRAPLLKPTRVRGGNCRTAKESRTSDDSIPISLFELEPGPTKLPPRKELNQDAFSAWLDTVSVLSSNRLKEDDSPRAHSDTPIIYHFSVTDVQWRKVRYVRDQPSNVHIGSHTRTLSGTGLDGPLSSKGGTTPGQSPRHGLGTPLGSLTPNNFPSSKSRDTKSDMSGSVDWEKSWPKRKPRRRHDTSENSNIGQPSHPLANTPISEDEISAIHARSQVEITTTPGYEEAEPSPLDAAQQNGLKSCPDLHTPSPLAMPSLIPRASADRDCGLKSPNYSRFDNSRHQHRLHVPASFSRRLRSFREKLGRKPSSSSYSLRSEFPPPPDGKERRILSRNSTDIWPSSGEESPHFNTPESDVSSMRLDIPRVDPLAATGGVPAIVGLERSSFSTQNIWRRSDRTSSGSESGSSPSGSTSAHTNSSTGQQQRQVQGGRRRRSRLSEVTTHDEADAPMEMISEGVSVPPSYVITIGRRQAPASALGQASQGGGVEQHEDEASQLSAPTRPPTKPSKTDPTPQTSIRKGVNLMGLSSEPSSPFDEVMGCFNTTGYANALYKLSQGSKPCHPNTWTAGQGEPGDSEPFCPSECFNNELEPSTF
ncbi:hypothetical protein F5Y17DRAFT_462261 [Xylariaceae sp. FL0594]|nr:hypothetical protein F5Y17DRAFT_462261 [Xylariaceae sp. FL0594]